MNMNGELDAIPACSQPVNADLAINWKNTWKKTPKSSANKLRQLYSSWQIYHNKINNQ